MGLAKKITDSIKKYLNNRILKIEDIIKLEKPSFHYSIIPVKIDRNSNKAYYNYNRKY